MKQHFEILYKNTKVPSGEKITFDELFIINKTRDKTRGRSNDKTRGRSNFVTQIW